MVQLSFKKSISHLNLLIIIIMLTNISACGYTFINRQKLPGGIKSIAITMFENRTGEIRAEAILTNALITELTRNADVALADRENADAVLEGEIVSARTDAVSRTSQDAVFEERINLVINVKLTDAQRKELWSAKGITANETYNVVSDNKIATEQNRKSAISELSEKIAENIYYQMTDIF